VHRVLHRFAHVAAAGRFATEQGITGWPEEEAFWAAGQCFQDWLKGRGGVGALETAAILSQVPVFFEEHGESRFSLWKPEYEDSRIVYRARFKRMEGEEMRYFVFSEVFKKEICSGLDVDLVSKVLIEKGWLIPDTGRKSTRAENLPRAGKTVRCYKINGEKRRRFVFLECFDM
jgi:putative DNA primase/helicase